MMKQEELSLKGTQRGFLTSITPYYNDSPVNI
jgi:hypothetical protein